MTLEVADDVRAQWDASTEEKRKMAHWEPPRDYVEQLHRFVQDPTADNNESIHEGVWLDWGCGGGALLKAVGPYPAQVVAVDVSRETLEKLRRRDGPLMKLEPHVTARLPAASIDVLCSFSCFQHFPSRAYGIEVLREMRRLAKPGALGFVQTRFYEPGRGNYFPEQTEAKPYAERYIHSCAYQIGEFWDELVGAGFAPTNVELEPWRGYAWYRFGG